MSLRLIALLPFLALVACPPADCPDADGDEVCDADDVCTGDDTTGDTDTDGVCDDSDVCQGDDASGDTDEDGVCDDFDACEGDDASGDTDIDGLCDDTDDCEGDNSSGDTDNDGVCDDTDACPDDENGDSDGDGVCDSEDPCPADNPDDSDGDGVCDADDVCPGATDNTDGTCTLVVKAETSPDLWANLHHSGVSSECPPTVATDITSQHGEPIAAVGSESDSGLMNELRVGLTFDTSPLPSNDAIVEVQLRVTPTMVTGNDLPIELVGGNPPIFGTQALPQIEPEDFSAGTFVIGTMLMSDIDAAGFAEFEIPANQVSTVGLTQYLLRADQACPYPEDGGRLVIVSPEGAPADAPTLTVTYNP